MVHALCMNIVLVMSWLLFYVIASVFAGAATMERDAGEGRWRGTMARDDGGMGANICGVREMEFQFF